VIEYGERKKPSHSGGDGPSFSEIVGQDELKRALLAVVANDDLDGLLVRGEKGTAKSTAVRGVAELLPEQTAVNDCPYGCPPDAPEAQCADCRERRDPTTTERPVPLVTLPLGATRERVVGTLSTADALAGDHEFDPGLLARANRGILYVDEVNLLDDHLVDVLLDAAASGVNRVERDGVSVTHPASFTLVGTMNPEEGELRPQLRDRFALGATVTACDDLDRRVSIVDRAIGRSDGGGTAGSASAPDEKKRRRQLRDARERLPDVTLPTEFVEEIAALCRDAGVDGHRGDIATARAARTFAALDGRSKVIGSDVRRAASLALPHRLRSTPFEDAPDADDLVDEQFDNGDAEGSGAGGGDTDSDESGDGNGSEEASDPSDARDDAEAGSDDESGTDDSGIEPETERAGDSSDPAEEDAGEGGDSRPTPGVGESSGDGGDGERSGADDCDAGGRGRDDEDEANPDDGTDATPLLPGQQRAEVGDADAPEMAVPEAVEDGVSGDGHRVATRPAAEADGPRVRTERTDPGGSVDAAASVRAAAARGTSDIESRDLRQSVRRSETAALVVFVVDTSASMRSAMRAAKGTVLELLRDAYQQRDEVAFVAFAGEDAEVLLPPTDSVGRAARHLKDLPTGDRTPLPAALDAAGEVIDRADPDASVVVLVTDGRANVADESPLAETRAAARRLTAHEPHVVVVDADDADTGLNGLVAEETDGIRVPLDALCAERIDAAVDGARETEI